MHLRCVYEPCPSQKFCASALQTQMVELCNRIMFDFYPGLPYRCISPHEGNEHLTVRCIHCGLYLELQIPLFAWWNHQHAKNELFFRDGTIVLESVVKF